MNVWRGFLLVLLKNDYPRWLILEIGADHPGEIEAVMKWIHPDISVVTRIGAVPVHIEHYRSAKDVVREKSFLARGVKSDGFLILNADDEDVMYFKEHTKARVVTFSVASKADIQASYINPTYDENKKLEGVSFKVDTNGSSIPITVKNVIGMSHVFPVLAAFAVIYALELNPLEASQAFTTYDYPRGRMNIISGINNSTIIDDSYNASPVAMDEAFRTIENLKVSGRKIGVLGDMLELGRHSLEEHTRLGESAAKIFDCLVTVGIRAKDMKEAAKKAGIDKKSLFSFGTSVEAGDFLKNFVKENDLVFVKGSQGIRMERIVEQIMAYPELKAKLLVRQEPEWLLRS